MSDDDREYRVTLDTTTEQYLYHVFATTEEEAIDTASMLAKAHDNMPMRANFLARVEAL